MPLNLLTDTTNAQKAVLAQGREGEATKQSLASVTVEASVLVPWQSVPETQATTP